MEAEGGGLTKGNPARANFLWFWNSQRYRPRPQQCWFSNPWNQRHRAGKAGWKALSLTSHAVSGSAPGGRTEADGGRLGVLGSNGDSHFGSSPAEDARREPGWALAAGVRLWAG